MESGGASRTAVFVCQGRAVADGRIAVDRFHDSVAQHLLSDQELIAVRLARAGGSPADGRERLTVKAVAACAEVIVPRTVLIDTALADALRRRHDVQVVLLGAGLDGRPWRLAALNGALVLSVDHPASQADLRLRANGLPPPICDLRFVPVDLATGHLNRSLRSAGHDPDRPTVWLWEGVIPYLSRQQVNATLDALSLTSGPGSTLIAQYQSPSLTAKLGRLVGGLLARLSGVASPLADEPWKSAWSSEQLARVLAERGWTIAADVDLLDYALTIGSPTRASRSLATGRVAVAHR